MEEVGRTKPIQPVTRLGEIDCDLGAMRAEIATFCKAQKDVDA